MKKMSKYARDRMQYKNKPRKILSLEERVQALRMFDQTPIYQRVATAFGCSWEQIKNVVISRNEILSYYARCQTVMPNEHPNQVRKKKIIFLGNVIFEYIRRAFYHKNGPLDEESIRSRALEFRNAIEIDQFYPNSAWLNDFKRVFNIELPNPKNIIITEKPLESLDCNDIIEYCRNEIDQILTGKMFMEKKSLDRENDYENGVCSTTISTTPMTAKTTTNQRECNEIIYFNDNLEGNGTNGNDAGSNHMDNDVDDDESAVEDEEGLTIDFSHYDYNDVANSNSQAICKSANEKRLPKTLDDSSLMLAKRIKTERLSKSPTPPTVWPSPPTSRKATPITANPISSPALPPQILSSKTALKYLIPLQDYALGEEDFIAINLLSSLADHFQRDINNENNK